MKKTVLVGGCSHSSSYYVRRSRTWHGLLNKKYDCKVIAKVSPGAGNLFIIDHLMWELNKTEVDLVIFQITEQFRTVLGLNHDELVRNDHENFKGASCKSTNIFFNGLKPFEAIKSSVMLVY